MGGGWNRFSIVSIGCLRPCILLISVLIIIFVIIYQNIMKLRVCILFCPYVDSTLHLRAPILQSSIDLLSSDPVLTIFCLELGISWYINMAICCDDLPYRIVEVDGRFSCAYCLHHQGDEFLIIEVVSTR
jgi:hypothetical protein